MREKFVTLSQYLPAGSNFPVTDAEAEKLLGELTVAETRHPEIAAAAKAALEQLGERPDDDLPLEAWIDARRKARALMWEALEGQLFEGITIIRKHEAPPAPATAVEPGPDAAIEPDVEAGPAA